MSKDQNSIHLAAVRFVRKFAFFTLEQKNPEKTEKNKKNI